MSVLRFGPSARKYHNVPCELDGYRFDSRAEMARYMELRLLAHADEIRGLEVHPKWVIRVNGVDVCRYVGDFSYWHTGDGMLVVEDVKSKPTRTTTYRLKRKLMRALYGIEITEVEA